jgi:hypothetical protein
MKPEIKLIKPMYEYSEMNIHELILQVSNFARLIFDDEKDQNYWIAQWEMAKAEIEKRVYRGIFR